MNAVQPMEAAARAALEPTATGVPREPFQVRGGLTFPGVNGEPDGLYDTPKDNIMPRAGFAYHLNDQTVVRGGYGMFYGFLGQRRGDVISSGFSQSANYTFSRFEQSEYLNGADPEPTRGISDQDSPHRLVVNGIWELPFGAGRRFGGNAPAAIAKIIGGWQISGIYLYQSHGEVHLLSALRKVWV
ncbi:MAG: hypothetical protein ACRD15_01325, partial [Vicinamibacterales bacterium]